MSGQIESSLAALPEPAPPAALARTVMARVSRLADERSRSAAASSSPAKISREGRHRSWNDTAPWTAAVGGLVIVFASWFAGRLQADSWLFLLWSLVAPPPALRTPADGTALTAFAMGLLLYVAGLFAPLHRRQ